MKTSLLISVLLCSSAGFAMGQDGPAFLNGLSFNSMTCQGDRYLLGNFYKHAGDVEVTIHDKNSAAPYVEVKTADDGQTFKIGNGFQGRDVQKSDCRYYSTEKNVFYLCDLMDPQKPLTFLAVNRARIKSVFGLNAIQPTAVGGGYIQLTNCKVKE